MSIAERVQQSVLKGIVTTHVRVYEMTNGALGGRFLGGPCCILTTVGAKSGMRRKLPLGYATDGADFILVASNGGSDHSPAWLANLRSDSRVEIQVGDEHHDGRARIVLPGDRDYDRLFSLVNANWGGRYYGYQQKTTRPIPVVVISPA